MDTQQFPFPRGGGQVLIGRGGDVAGWPDGLSWVMFALLLLLFLIAVASLALALYDRSHRTAAPGVSGALAELDLRYALGEVDRDEYLRRRADLGGQAAPAPEATTVVAPPPAEPQPT